MAKIKAGILSKVSGKVAGVVGATWKGTNYLRELVKPSNPNTALQQAQRSKMSATVKCARNFVGDVFKPYLDKFLKNISGYNWFVKSNIGKFGGLNNTLTAALDFSFGTMQSGGTPLWPANASQRIATPESDIPSVPAGHTLRAVGVLWDDTKGKGAVAIVDSPSAAENVTDALEDYGFASGDKVSCALFYVDIDANGVVQEISTAQKTFVTLS